MKKNFIPAIFNYCDRWCERCAFTDRCGSFAMIKDWKEKHPNQKDDWGAQLSDNFDKAISMLQQLANEKGIDLDALPIYTPPPVNSKLVIRQEYTIQLVRHYEGLVKSWKNDHQILVEKWSEHIYRLREMGISNMTTNIPKEQNAYEIICWYLYFIRPKVNRAYLVMKEGINLAKLNIQNDMNGSAKIAIIAIDRSLAAWEMLREAIPNEGDVIIDIMVSLAAIKRRLLSEFPNAMQFKRPGFDE